MRLLVSIVLAGVLCTAFAASASAEAPGGDNQFRGDPAHGSSVTNFYTETGRGNGSPIAPPPPSPPQPATLPMGVYLNEFTANRDIVGNDGNNNTPMLGSLGDQQRGYSCSTGCSGN